QARSATCLRPAPPPPGTPAPTPTTASRPCPAAPRSCECSAVTASRAPTCAKPSPTRPTPPHPPARPDDPSTTAGPAGAYGIKRANGVTADGGAGAVSAGVAAAALREVAGRLAVGLAAITSVMDPALIVLAGAVPMAGGE